MRVLTEKNFDIETDAHYILTLYSPDFHDLHGLAYETPHPNMDGNSEDDPGRPEVSQQRPPS